ncbi:MAG: cytochrome c oxidase assembly protein [Pseudomonadota bacterium]|nr:cytochrome c oxidase assembly protein [Pseudomonadota bacterium]
MQIAVSRISDLGRDDPIGLAGVFGFGAVLSWLCAAHPTVLPPWAPWDFSWAEYLATTLGVWWYLRGVARSAPEMRPPIWRQASFLLGVAVIYAVLQTRFEYMAQHEFFLNRIQHIFMHHLGPFLLALAWPGAVLRRGMPAPVRRLSEARLLARIMRVVQQPLLASLLFVGLIYLFLIPAVQFRAMIDPRLYAVMNWSMVVDGIFFWSLVLDPRPKSQAGVSYVTRLALPLFVMFPQIALGAHIAFSAGGLYPYYDLCGRLFQSVSAAADQHTGGIIIWIPAGMMSAIAFMTVLNALRIHEDSLPSDLGDTENDGSRTPAFDASAWTGR